MAGTISLYTFQAWAGRLAFGDKRAGVLPPEPGVDGNAVVFDAYSSEPAEIVTADTHNNLQDARSRAFAYRSLVGTNVPVYDPVGMYWPSCTVIRANPLIEVDVFGKYRVTTSWTLLPTTQDPEQVIANV